MKIEGKVALLTGASKGLGRQLAIQLDAKGCRLLLTARDAERLAHLQKNLITRGSKIFPANLGDSRSRMQLVNNIRETEPQLDLIIHCAGIGNHSRLEQLTQEEINQLLQLNTVAPIELTAALAPLLPENETGGIVTIGSVAGELTTPGMSLYAASKAALHSFSRSTEIELAANKNFSLLVILGALRGTEFAQALRNPIQGQPGWYRKLDIDATHAAQQIISAIEHERTRLVIPRWYAAALFLSRLFEPLTKTITRRYFLKQSPKKHKH